ncbi:MAG: pentapeptide repeat-containing protein [Ilumatobacter sp.]|jgi:hypothetical protein|nr:pentapeptide repeat-containing protein [Ilumatobacter sp.]
MKPSSGLPLTRQHRRQQRDPDDAVLGLPHSPETTPVGSGDSTLIANRYSVEPGADLSLANLSTQDLPGANLSGAFLTDAFLTSANLSGANLSSAVLSEAWLLLADLRNADLYNANLSGANLKGANHTCDTTRWLPLPLH